MGQYLSWWTIVMIVRGWLSAHWGPRTYCLCSSNGRTSMLPCYMHTARGISDGQHGRLRLNQWKDDNNVCVLENLPTLPRHFELLSVKVLSRLGVEGVQLHQLSPSTQFELVRQRFWRSVFQQLNRGATGRRWNCAIHISPWHSAAKSAN